MVRQFSAGGFVYKKQEGNILWLIRRSRANPGFTGNLGWSWPKGWIDKGEDAKTAATREVREECGVEAEIIDKIDTIKIFFKDKGELVMKDITYFIMEWKRDIPEGHDSETEEVRWVEQGQAEEMLVFDNEKKLLNKAGEMVI